MIRRSKRRLDPQAPPQPPSLIRRTVGFLVKASGLIVIATGMAALSTHWLWTVLAMFVGLGLFIVGAEIAPVAKTGAFIARNLMESDAYDLHYVRPPGGYLTDSFDGPDSDRFIGR